MSTFKHFLLNESRTKPINDEEAIQWIKQNCPRLVKMSHRHGHHIYRGLDEKDNAFLFADPATSHPRTSANTTNHYTLLIDNLPSWKSYPKRSQSFICSTVLEGAEKFGIPFAVFPPDGTTIGIAPDDDIWNSFHHLYKQVGLSIDDFNQALQNITGLVTQSQDTPITFSQLQRQLQQVQQAFDANGIEYYQKQLPRGHRANLLMDAVKQHNSNILQAIEEWFKPSENRFDLAESHTIITNRQKEIWFSSQAVFVNMDAHDLEDMLFDIHG